MSDETAAPPPAETPAPEATPADPKVEAKPEVDEFEELLKKKPLKYKAAGKEKSLTSSKDLQRLLSRVDGTDAAATEALKAKEEAAALKARREQVKRLKGAERARAIAEFFEEDPEAMREAFAEDILADDARRQERAKLSERERQMADELDRYRSEHAKLQEEHAAAQRQREEEAYIARVRQTGERLEKVTLGALQKAKIPGTAAPAFIRAIADHLDRNERLGLELDEDEIAGRVLEEQGAMADTFYGSLDVGALADRLEAQMGDDPTKPGEKVSRLKLLMRECARRIKAKSGGAALPMTNGHAPAQRAPETDADKIAFWRGR